MAKRKKRKRKESVPQKPIKYEDTTKFKAIDMMMRANKGVRIE